MPIWPKAIGYWLIVQGQGGTPGPPPPSIGPGLPPGMEIYPTVPVAVNVESNGPQPPFVTLTAPVPGLSFIVRRAGAMKATAYAWTKTPQVSMGTVAPWTNVFPNNNLQLTPGYGRTDAEPHLRAVPDGSAVVLDVNVTGQNGMGTASVYPFLIGFWADLT